MTLEAFERLLKITRIGNRAVRKAQGENRRKGIPNVYDRNGKPYYELPTGRSLLYLRLLRRKMIGSGKVDSDRHLSKKFIAMLLQ